LTAYRIRALEYWFEAGEDAMGEVVNLNRFRKARAKDERVRQAEGNRLQHGLGKTDKQRILSERERAERDLDGKKLT
jgi:hypothetical protein